MNTEPTSDKAALYSNDEALLGVCFVHPSWLGGPLTPHNVLDYFSASDFYDKSCNNELLRMQERDMTLLRDMTGLEYDVRFVDETQGIFVICKQTREGPELVHPQAYYYVMHGTVYQCPTIQHVLTARMTTCSYHLEEAFRMVSTVVRFDPSTEPNYTYHFNNHNPPERDDALENHDNSLEATPLEKTQEEIYRLQQTADRSSRILSSIVSQFPLPGEVSAQRSSSIPTTTKHEAAEVRRAAGGKTQTTKRPDIAHKRRYADLLM